MTQSSQSGYSVASGIDAADVNPILLAHLRALAAAGYPVEITSGYRTRDRQTQLYNQYVASGYNQAHIAAKPGLSAHEYGLAVDATVNGAPIGSLGNEVLARFGLVAPVKGDPVHLELAANSPQQLGLQTALGRMKTMSPGNLPPSGPQPNQAPASAPAPDRSQLILQALQKHPRLDPQAVLAVAAQEGMGGGVGDNGTSFGPWQLHQGGAYPAFAPQEPQAAQSWAWSPQGINYALNQIAGVARDQRGPQAVQSIVSKFERPANPQGEIQRALAAYGKQPAAAPAGMPPTTALSGSPARPGRPPIAAPIRLALQLLGAGR